MSTPNSTNDSAQNSTAEPPRLQREGLPTARTRCGRCRVKRAAAGSRWPTCLRCLELGLECDIPFKHQKTLRPDAKVMMKQGYRALRHEIIIKKGEELPENEKTPTTEDGPEPGISQAQGTLDSWTEPNSIGDKVAGNNIMSAEGVATQRQIPAGGRPNCRSLRINSVEVLGWPVFAGQSELQAKGMAALPQKHSERQQPSLFHLELFLYGPIIPDRLVRQFIQNVHTKNPILDVTSLRKRAEDVFLRGIEYNSESCLMLLVWALGAISMPFAESEGKCCEMFREMGLALFAMASKRLGTAFAEDGILPAQCFFFAGLYLSFTLQPVAAWRHFLQALAYCQEFDVAIQGARKTREPAGAPEPPPAELVLYWCCLKAELDLRLSLGLFDFQVQDRVYPGPLPDIAVDTYVPIRVRLFTLAELSLLRLTTSARNEIGQILSSFAGGNDGILEARLIKTVDSYDRKAKDWLAALPQAMSFELETTEFDTYRFILYCRLLDFEELIFWPFIEDAINSGEESLAPHV